MNKKLFLCGLVVGLFFTIVFLKHLFRGSVEIPDLTLCSFELVDLEGNPFSTKSLEGKPTVLNIWATWCGPCKMEFPDFEKVKKELGDSVQFVMISDETADKIESFKKSNSYTFNFVRAKNKIIQVNVRPFSLFFNKEGKLIHKASGLMEETEIRKAVRLIKN